MTFTHAQIATMHGVYVNLTAMDVPLNMGRIFSWECFMQKYSAVELKLTIDFIKIGIRNKRRHHAALKFSNLIQNIDGFEETLAEARGMAHVRAKASRPTPRPTRAESVTQAGTRSERKLDEIVSSPAFKAFVALKENL